MADRSIVQNLCEKKTVYAPLPTGSIIMNTAVKALRQPVVLLTRTDAAASGSQDAPSPSKGCLNLPAPAEPTDSLFRICGEVGAQQGLDVEIAPLAGGQYPLKATASNPMLRQSTGSKAPSTMHFPLPYRSVVVIVLHAVTGSSRAKG
jgi:hypothetical protein